MINNHLKTKFRVIASPSQTLQVTCEKTPRCVVLQKEGRSWLGVRFSHLAAQHSQTLRFLHCCCVHCRNSKATCRFNTWNLEKYLDLYSLGGMNLTLLDLLYFAHLLTLLYETLQLLLTRAEAEFFESRKLFSYHISSKSTDAFSSQFYHRNKSI